MGVDMYDSSNGARDWGLGSLVAFELCHRCFTLYALHLACHVVILKSTTSTGRRYISHGMDSFGCNLGHIAATQDLIRCDPCI